MRRLSLALLLGVFVIAAPAFAQKDKDGKGKPTSSAEEQAKEHYAKAETHYRLQEYELAIGELKEAYRLAPKPLLLYNLAQCYKELKDYESAISYFENYLDKSPKAKNRGEVEGLLKEVREAKAKQDEERRLAEEERLAQERLLAMSKPPGGDPAKKPTILSKWWFWSAVGGAALAGTGTAVLIANAPPRTDLGNINILDK
jgi:tetratricopeptide (TPR) repeat protein